MSDRRVVLLVVAVLLALIGVVITIASALGLRDPLQRGGDLGERMDMGGFLIGTLAIGVVLTVASAATAVGLLRAQLRKAS